VYKHELWHIYHVCIVHQEVMLHAGFFSHLGIQKIIRAIVRSLGQESLVMAHMSMGDGTIIKEVMETHCNTLQHTATRTVTHTAT